MTACGHFALVPAPPALGFCHRRPNTLGVIPAQAGIHPCILPSRLRGMKLGLEGAGYGALGRTDCDPSRASSSYLSVVVRLPMTVSNG